MFYKNQWIVIRINLKHYFETCIIKKKKKLKQIIWLKSQKNGIVLFAFYTINL